MNAPGAPVSPTKVDHRRLSADTFNRTWDLLEQSRRTPAEDELMLTMARASLHHWNQRPDVTELNRSIGHWLISRVLAVLGRGPEAREEAQLSLAAAKDEASYYVGYAHEALARAAQVMGNEATRDRHLELAGKYAAQVTDATNRKMLKDDLTDLRGSAIGKPVWPKGA